MEKEINWNAIKLFEKEEAFNGLALYLSQLLKPKKITPKFIKALSGSDNKKKIYKTFTIPKRLGGVRIIDAPNRELRFVQRLLLHNLSQEFNEHKCAYGFVKGKSIEKNAKLHVKKRFVYTVDLKDFFPSITWQRVFGMFQSFPFNASKDIARIISNLVTFNEHLPQGAPTSPFLSNMLCRKLDSRLLKWAADNNYTYSRYADDLTFSTLNKNCFPKNDRDFIEKIIADEKFEINQSKKRLIPYFKRQMVTGVVVNKKVNIKKNYIRKIRAILHNIEKFGIESQINRKFQFEEYSKFVPYKNRQISKYGYLNVEKVQSENRIIINPADDLHVLSEPTGSVTKLSATQTERRKENFRRKLKGMIEFVGMVNGKGNKRYLTLKERYDCVVLGKDKTKTKNWQPHDPMKVFHFFSRFSSASIDDISQLIHTYSEDINVEEMIVKVDKVVSKFNEQTKKYEPGLPYYLFTHIQKDLINLWESEGKALIGQFNVWPYAPTDKNSPTEIKDFTEKILLFRKSINFGNINDRTNFIDLIESLAKNKNKILNLNYNISLENQLHFSTDVKRIEYALKKILEMITQNTNEFGEIFIKTEYQNEAKNLLLKIIHKNSHFNKDKFKEGADSQHLRENLWSLCNFKYYYKKDNTNFEYQLLPEITNAEKETSADITGFVYEFNFTINK